MSCSERVAETTKAHKLLSDGSATVRQVVGTFGPSVALAALAAHIRDIADDWEDMPEWREDLNRAAWKIDAAIAPNHR